MISPFRVALWVALLSLFANDLAAQQPDQERWMSKEELKERVNNSFAPPKDCKSLHPSDRVWIDRNEQVVVVDGYIAQREAPLEMFACPAGTKEHESVVAVFARSQLVHAALLAIGAKPGSPAKFEPFKPAHGSTIRIYAVWLDEKGAVQSTLAQKWVRHMGTKDNLKWDWVFAGSKEYFDEYSKERRYMADSGELVCVANFGTSTMDLVVRSEQANSNLAFDAYTDRIPKRNTPIRLVLKLVGDVAFGSEPEHEKEKPDYQDKPVPETVTRLLEAVKK
ncbi:YdjY domain-containing protein [Pirellulaceae bacterium SH501]